MKKAVIFWISLILVAGPASAVKYSTVIYDDGLNEHFAIEGWINSQNQKQTGADLKYNISLIRPGLNYTEIHSFKISLADNDDILASQDAGGFKINSTEHKTGFVTIAADRPPDRVNQVIFEINHTGTLRDGGKLNTYAEGRVDYTITDEYPQILSFETESESVERGRNITIEADTENIRSLKLQGRNMTENGNGRFKTELKVPEDLSAGNNHLNYTLKTENGLEFEENLNITIENQAPELNVSYPAEIARGSDMEIKLGAQDDLKINRSYVSFQGRNYSAVKGAAIVPEDVLKPGEHSFAAVATDNEGGETRRTHSFEVLKASENGETQRKEKSSHKGNASERSDKKQAKSFPEVIIDPIISFLKGIL